MAKKPTVRKIFLTTFAINNRFGNPIQFAYQYQGEEPGIKRQIHSMTFNSNGRIDIQRVLRVGIASILMIQWI